MSKIHSTHVLGALLAALVGLAPIHSALAGGRAPTRNSASAPAAPRDSAVRNQAATAALAAPRASSERNPIASEIERVSKPEASQQRDRLTAGSILETVKHPSDRGRAGLGANARMEAGSAADDLRNIAKRERSAIADVASGPTGNPYAAGQRGPDTAPSRLGGSIGSSRTGNLNVQREPGTGGLFGELPTNDTLSHRSTIFRVRASKKNPDGTITPGSSPILIAPSSGNPAVTVVNENVVTKVVVKTPMVKVVNTDGTTTTMPRREYEQQEAAKKKKAEEAAAKRKAEEEKKEQEEAEAEESEDDEEEEEETDDSWINDGDPDNDPYTPNPMDDTMGQKGELPGYTPMHDSNKLYGPGQGPVVLTEEQVAERMAWAEAEANARIHSLINPGDDVQGTPSGEAPELDDCIYSGGNCEPETVAGQ